MKKIYEKLKKDELYYLFALRMFPFTPLFLSNFVMGLSSIKLSGFYFISFLALLPWVAIYVNMGSQLSRLEDLQGFVAPGLLFAIALMGFFPLSVKYFFRFIKRLKRSKKNLPLEFFEL